VKELERLEGRQHCLEWMMSCNLLPGSTCTTKLILVKSHVLQAGDHPSLVGFFEVAHTDMRNSSIPKPPKRRLGEEACH
jgi:hypothetical protein